MLLRSGWIKLVLWVFLFSALRLAFGAGNTDITGKIDRVDLSTGEIEIQLPKKKQLQRGGNYNIVMHSGKVIGSYKETASYQRGSRVTSRGIAVIKHGTIYAGLNLHLVKVRENAFQGDGKPHPAKFWGNETPNLNSKDSVEMVHIPAGKFRFGSSLVGTWHYTYKPENGTGKDFADIASFYIDKFEVSRKRFSVFLRETNTPFSMQWAESDSELPADKVTYEHAQAYCKWAGKRLLSELEWEKAARGGLPHLHAGHIVSLAESGSSKYSDEGRGQNCITLDSGRGLKPVHQMADKSPYGVYGLCGNAAEWTSSWLLPYRGNTQPDEHFGRKYKVIRGGAYDLDKKYARVYERMAGGIPSLSKDYRAGFRCGLSVQ